MAVAIPETCTGCGERLDEAHMVIVQAIRYTVDPAEGVIVRKEPSEVAAYCEACRVALGDGSKQ